MASQTLMVLLSVLVFYLISILLIRKVNEKDPQYFKCIYRYISNYEDYYPSSEFYPGKSNRPKSHFE